MHLSPPGVVNAQLSIAGGQRPALRVVCDDDGDVHVFDHPESSTSGGPDLYGMAEFQALVDLDPTLADVPPLKPLHVAHRSAVGAPWLVEAYEPDPQHWDDPDRTTDPMNAVALILANPDLPMPDYREESLSSDRFELSARDGSVVTITLAESQGRALTAGLAVRADDAAYAVAHTPWRSPDGPEGPRVVRAIVVGPRAAVGAALGVLADVNAGRVGTRR